MAGLPSPCQVDRAVFTALRPTLDSLYETACPRMVSARAHIGRRALFPHRYHAMCSETDATYISKLREMSMLLPQHMGLRPGLHLLPASLGGPTARAAKDVASLWAAHRPSRPPTPEPGEHPASDEEGSGKVRGRFGEGEEPGEHPASDEARRAHRTAAVQVRARGRHRTWASLYMGRRPLPCSDAPGSAL